MQRNSKLLAMSLAVNVVFLIFKFRPQGPHEHNELNHKPIAATTAIIGDDSSGWIRGDRLRESAERVFLDFDDGMPVETTWKVAKTLPIDFSTTWDSDGYVSEDMIELLGLNDVEVESVNQVIRNLEETFKTTEAKEMTSFVDSDGVAWSHLRLDRNRASKIISEGTEQLHDILGDRSKVVIDLFHKYHHLNQPYREGMDQLIRYSDTDNGETLELRSFDADNPDDQYEETYLPASNLFRRYRYLK